MIAGPNGALQRTLGTIRTSIATRAPFEAEVLRDKQRISVTVPTLPDEQRSLGVELSQFAAPPVGRAKLSPSQSAARAVAEVNRDMRGG